MNIGHCVDDGVEQPGISVYPNVGLHSKVPQIDLLGLMHLWITLTTTILGGTRRGKQGGVNYGSGLKHQPPLGQGRVNGGQQPDA